MVWGKYVENKPLRLKSFDLIWTQINPYLSTIRAWILSIKTVRPSEN
jgi:hypothetical protein